MNALGKNYDALKSRLDQYYLRARYYNPASGRFTQQDSWMGNNSDPITLHKYLYADASPVNKIDPSGHMSLVSEMAAVGTIGVLSTVAYNNWQAANRFNNTAAWGEEDWSRTNVAGWLVLAAMASSGTSMLDKITDKINSDDDTAYVFYHGTDQATGAYLAAGGNIDAEAITKNRQWNASTGGFYLADSYEDAFWFGQFHADSGFVVVEYLMTASALGTLKATGASITPIPQAPGFWPVGNEMVVPVPAFPVFNGLMRKGQIIPSIAPF
ncbi:MAG: RHS repeat-associated core domain-containing protein [Candidatus Thiodiazotropha sp.]